MNNGLKFPRDADKLLRKKKTLKRQLLEQSGLLEIRVAILGGSTTAEIKDILELYLLRLGLRATFHESSYNRYYEDVMFDDVALQAFQPDIIFIHTSSVNLQHGPELVDALEEIDRKLQRELERFASLWKKIETVFSCPIIQNNFELPDTRALGHLEASDSRGVLHFIARLNGEFAAYAQSHTNFHLNDIHYLSAWYGLERWHDRTAWYAYKYALSLEAIPLLAHSVATIIGAIYGKRRKCLVLDLDNTLWGGMIGEDGVERIQIGRETAVAEAYTGFQEYLKALKNRGVMLAACSKNEEENARAGLLHPDSVLRIEDFAAFRANWEPKYLNIQAMAEELNIGLDSMVFLDDEPVEREAVRVQLPEVVVPEFGNDVTEYARILDGSGLLEPAGLSQEDLRRTDYYHENRERGQLEHSFQSYEDFLQSLDLEAEISPFKEVYLDRIAQLTNKTNQFNLTTKRYTPAEIKAIAGNSDYLTLYGRLSDKFGDNGVVSVIVGRVEDPVLHLDLWLMSCRVIKRGLEFAMCDTLVELCRAAGIARVMGYYYRSPRNGIVKYHYREMGFELVADKENGDSEWELSVSPAYRSKNKWIRVNDDARDNR